MAFKTETMASALHVMKLLLHKISMIMQCLYCGVSFQCRLFKSEVGQNKFFYIGLLLAYSICWVHTCIGDGW